MTDDLRRLRARYDRLKTLYRVSTVIHSTLDPQQALALIVREAVRVTRASSGSVALLNPTTGFLEIQAARGLPPKSADLKLRLGEGITGWVARTGEAARVGEVAKDPRYLRVRANVRSELAVPLEVNGEVRGVLNVDSDRGNAFRAEDQELLEALAVQAAKVISNTWLFEQLRQKARLFESLLRVSKTINSTVNLDEALEVITREACQLMGGKMSSLLLLSEDAEWLDLRASFGAGPGYIGKPRVNAAESLLGVVVRRQKPIQVENVQTSSRYQSIEVARREGLVSLLSVPLAFGGQTTGTLNVYTGEPHNFSNEEIGILSTLGELSAIAIEKARLHERVVDAEAELRRSEKLTALGLLAAEVAHEIRNPLTVMKMLYHSLDLKFPADDPRAKDVQIMSAKMDHLNRIVEQVLDFTRNTEPQMAPVDLNRLLDDLSLLARHKLSHHGITLLRQFEAELPAVMADRGQLEQAFLNLILNAVDAMPHGGRLVLATRSIRPGRASSAPAQLAVECRDTGEGMPAEQVEGVHTPLLSSKKAKGTGLGLAIVRRVVEFHRGEMAIKSRRRRGTTVTVILPVCERTLTASE